jgi:hypothetical protein
MGWKNGSNELTLEFVTKVGAPSFVIEVVTDGVAQRFASIEEFASYQ